MTCWTPNLREVVCGPEQFFGARLRDRIALGTLIVATIQGCNKQTESPSTVAVAESLVANHSPQITSDESMTRGYSNSVNRLVERRIEVLNDQGRQAVTEPQGRRIQDVQLQIVWTLPDEYDWNYCIPELQRGKNRYETEYPSALFFLEKKLGAKTALEVSIPDTRYSFYIINGQVAPFFLDSEKMVIWQLDHPDLERKFHQLRTVSTSSKRIGFTVPGGDCEESLIVDFSDRENSPKVIYYVEFHGP